MSFHFTKDQILALEIIAGDPIYIMLFGGSRSGKTFLHVRNIVTRALKAPRSRHCILRFRFSHCKQSIMLDTFPRVMELCYSNISYRLDKQDYYAAFPNGSEIWFGGLDDKERTEKILGKEYVTILLNECSQLSWSSIGIVITRLAQLVNQIIDGKEEILTPKIYMDCNPPNKLHWTYSLFIKKIDPEMKLPLINAKEYASMQMNPEGNKENITPGYIETLKGMSARLRKRFLYGEFADAVANALFPDETIEKYRVIDHSEIPTYVRIVIGVDPSGAGDVDNADNDAIGIVVVGLGVDGRAYVIEDCTIKAGPGTWGRVVGQAYDRHEADCVIGEVNYGGAMVAQTIQIARPRTPFRAVTASRGQGKHVRAEPISGLYEAGKVRHIGVHRDLEEELSGFTTVGYVGDASPNRADALIWAIHALFPALTAPTKKASPELIPTNSPFARKM